MIDLSAIDTFKLREELTQLGVDDLAMLAWKLGWLGRARPKQIEPDCDWNIWGIVSGRGWGKTDTGANWTLDQAWYKAEPGSTGLIIAPTHNDLRGTCFEGPSGLLKIIPDAILADYNRSNMEIVLKNGTLLRGFAATEPDRLRGINSSFVWGDELAAWPYPQETWDMMQFGLRIGEHPRVLFTTTPKPIPLLRHLVDSAAKKDSKVIITTGSTYENRDNLATTFFDEIEKYSSTQLGRQEIEGELLDMEEQGIFKRSWFQLFDADKPFPIFETIVQSWDCAFSEKDLSPSAIDRRLKDPDYTACTTWGLFRKEMTEAAPGVHDTRSPWAILLLDAWQEHMGFPELRKRALQESRTKYGPEKSARRPDIILVEDKGPGSSLIQELREAGVNAVAYNPQRDSKLQRAHVVSHMPANGLIYLPESPKRRGQHRDWIDPWLEQMCMFSTLTLDKMHDDFVDSTTQAWKVLNNITPVTVDPIPEPPTVDYHEERKSGVNPYDA